MKNSPSGCFSVFTRFFMICVCDYRTPASVLEALNKKFDVIQLPFDSALPVPVWGHSDLLIFRLEDYLIVRLKYYYIARREIDLICKKAGLKLLLSDIDVGLRYPNDCALCAAVSGKHLICREASTDREILGLARELGYQILNVPQGYSKCSCAILADGSIITADRGIASVTLKNGIDTLLISAGQIDLPGYSYGFIGGATGLCGDVLYFCGDIATHHDHKDIEEFARKHNTECVSLGEGKLYDVGSLIFL
jgi:hypothetical protein